MLVDHVMGCFYCCRKRVFDELDGYDETFLRGQTIDFSLRARLAGWSCIAVPHIEYVHAHGQRKVPQAQMLWSITHALIVVQLAALQRCV